MVGTTISHYKVLEKIGEGGMGVVYRATDTKLNRDVALKILPERFASDSQRMARFQREAEVLASLDHPNIGQIYGIEEAGQTKALVLQLIEGPTLAERIAQGPIPVEEALKIALQMAEGLEAAHEKGVIHRDLKPANVKITPEGQVKILDFGLAKALEGETLPDTNLSQSPTLTAAATQAGVILGTAAYMSPEQAKATRPIPDLTHGDLVQLFTRCSQGRGHLRGRMSQTRWQRFCGLKSIGRDFRLKLQHPCGDCWNVALIGI